MPILKKLIALFAACAALLLTATPASAEVDGKCGRYLCVLTAHHNRYVQDITVRTRDGLPGTLRAWWGPYQSPRVRAAGHRWVVNQEHKKAKLVCGGLERDGRTIEDGVCVRI